MIIENGIMWVISHRYGSIRTDTLSYRRKDTVKKFLGESKMSWAEWRKLGWEVRKVEVTIKTI